jgi:hypothetical protein
MKNYQYFILFIQLIFEHGLSNSLSLFYYRFMFKYLDIYSKKLFKK